jgi:hypothetical protein
MASLMPSQLREYEIRDIMKELKPTLKFTFDEKELLFTPEFDSMNPSDQYRWIQSQIEQVEEEEYPTAKSLSNSNTLPLYHGTTYHQMSENAQWKHDERLRNTAIKKKEFWTPRVATLKEHRKQYIEELVERRRRAIQIWEDRKHEKEYHFFYKNHRFEQLKSELDLFWEKGKAFHGYRPENSFGLTRSFPEDIHITKELSVLWMKVLSSFHRGVITPEQKTLLQDEINTLRRTFLREQAAFKRSTANRSRKRSRNRSKNRNKKNESPKP